MKSKRYSEEEIYEIVSSKWNVDHPDGSCNTFELMCKANSMGYTETSDDVWEKENAK